MNGIDDLARLRCFRWNVLQAFDRGGGEYLRNCVQELVDRQHIEVDAILLADERFGRDFIDSVLLTP